jgi:hypothetical protein
MSKDDPVRYEVIATVPRELAAAYEAYLRREHVPDLMGTGCFVEAEFARDAGGAGNAGAEAVRFRSAYLASSPAALERYFEEHAPRLRAHALQRFPGGLSFEREKWQVLERWKAEG